MVQLDSKLDKATRATFVGRSGNDKRLVTRNYCLSRLHCLGIDLYHSYFSCFAFCEGRANVWC